jgi:hypothetical protein
VKEMKNYTDIQVVNQFEMLKKSCDARGFTIAIEEVKSFEAGKGCVDISDHIVIRRKSDGVTAHISISFVHAQGFLDGLDYAKVTKQ